MIWGITSESHRMLPTKESLPKNLVDLTGGRVVMGLLAYDP